MIKNIILFILFFSHFALAQTYIQSNSLIQTPTSIVSAASTTVLTLSSNTNLIVTGSTTQILQLPVATTLKDGKAFNICNESTGVTTVTYSDTTTLQTVAPSTCLYISLYVNSSADGTWTLQATPIQVLTIGAIDGGSASANGASIASNVLYMQSASGTNPGLINTTTQTIAGAKTFTTDVSITSNALSIPNIIVTDTETGGIFTGGIVSLLSDYGGAITSGNGIGTIWFGGAYDTSHDLNSESAAIVARGTQTWTSAHAGSAMYFYTTQNNANSWTQALAINQDQSATFTNTVNATTFVGALTGHASLDLALTGGTMSGAITMGSNQIHTVTDPTSAQDAATKNYVDTQLAQLNPLAAVYAASTANIAGTYVNAVSGICIGDTFTTTATTAFAIDGTSPSVGARILFKNQTSTFQDGVWTFTTQAVSSVSGAVFTRALDFDSSADINSGSIIPVINGTANAGSSWYQTGIVTTCNTDAQTWTQFQKASSAYLLAANNLSDVATKATAFNNISPLSTAGDTLYGGSSGSGSRLAIGTAGQAYVVNSGATAPQWATLGVSGGGTGLNSGTSGGIPYYSSTSAITSSGLLTSNGVVLGGGSGGSPTSAGTGTAGQAFISAGTSAPAFGAAMGFSVNTSSTAAGTSTAAVYSNVVSDASSGYNNTTGGYTIPAGGTGLWQFDVTMYSSATNPAALVKDGSTTIGQGSVATAGAAVGVASIIYPVTAGDIISVYSAISSTLSNSAPYLNSFSGHKIR